MGFVANGPNYEQAQTQDEQLYDITSTIDTLHQGVRYTITVAQIISLKTIQRIKAAIRFTA